jgi:2,4-dienoyl-CoA reductase-like NADH-dependent reductase (Old Yellow Enzyme family)
VPQGDQIRGSKSNGSGDVLFSPIRLGPLEVKNRLFRSSAGGRFDNYDGSGTPVRINWDLKVAQGGAGAIISSNAPVSIRGRLVPGYALVDADDKIPFWRELGRRIHEHDCKYILQLAHAGRERLVHGIEYETGLSSTKKPEPLNGFRSSAMTAAQIREVIEQFAQGARRAREAGLDGIELAGANGVLFTQFLSSEINDRTDEWGGPLENRARFALEVVSAIRREIGDDFCLGFKISLREHLDEVLPWLDEGNTLEESLQVCRWLEDAGVDYFHVSTGGEFPHPRNPAGAFPVRQMLKTYDGQISDGKYTFRNYLLFRSWPANVLWKRHWAKPARKAGGPEGINLPDARALKQIATVPILVTGGFQTASVIRSSIERGDCDGVTMARTLIANPHLPNMFAAGLDRAPRPCTYCNKCLFTFIEDPLGCYEESRFDSREEMVHEIMSVYEPYTPPTRAGAASEVVA